MTFKTSSGKTDENLKFAEHQIAMSQPQPALLEGVGRYLNEDVPTPTDGGVVQYFLSHPSAQVGEPLGGLISLWIPSQNIGRVSNVRQSVATRMTITGELSGAIKMMSRINAKQAMWRTAALLSACKSVSEQKAILKVATLRVLELARPDLTIPLRGFIAELLQDTKANSVLELWPNRAAHLLPLEPKGLDHVEDAALGQVLSSWLVDISAQLTVAQILPRSSPLKSAPPAGSFFNVFDQNDGADLYKAPGSVEWQTISRSALMQLIQAHSISSLSERFNISRGSIRKTCTTLGIDLPGVSQGPRSRSRKAT